MDSIIGLLVVLIPVVFTLVGKKLEKAGKEAGNTVDVPPIPEPVDKQNVVEEAVRVLPPKLPKQKAKPYGVKEEDKHVKKEPIDPKKLVIYSEIMKPKF